MIALPMSFLFSPTGASRRFWRSPPGICLLLLPALGAIWFGLNLIRVDTYIYAADTTRHLGDFRQTLYWNVVEIQAGIVWIAIIDAVFGLLYAAAAAARRGYLKTN
jgi:hypothetical protein